MTPCPLRIALISEHASPLASLLAAARFILASDALASAAPELALAAGLQ